MGGCSAANCSNHSRNGYRMFRFPREKERRAKWIQNCRRNNWEPSQHAQLCSEHFEESQYELNRKDNRKLLKNIAIPTIFNVPNPPPGIMDKRKRKDRVESIEPNYLSTETDNAKENVSYIEMCQKVQALERENQLLKLQMEKRNSRLQIFLAEDQISSLDTSVKSWSEQSIIKGLKLRFALGKNGYNYLRLTGYPAPAYSTLNRRIQNIKFQFGVIHPLLSLLKTKVANMDNHSKNCVLLVDEMEIASHQDFDTSNKSFIGNVTLGTTNIANHYMVVMLRGISYPWKQVVAHELTGKSTSGPDMKSMIVNTIQMARSVGLNVRASTSDMASCNKSMWSELGVSVTREERKTTYVVDEGDSFCNTIYTIADVPHLIKNMRSAFLTKQFILPDDLCKEQNLPSPIVCSSYLKQLWIDELECDTALRSLFHLKKDHLFPSHFNKMNVATAVQLFSVQTAAAIEKAVSLQQVHLNALTSAWWIRFMAQWFEIMTARHPKKAITLKNKEEKFEVLNFTIQTMQKIRLGPKDCWKPLQTGMIMSSISVMGLVNELFQEGIKFLLPGRLTQDALENVFSQIRRKSGSKPTALQAKTAMRLICVSQFISDVKNTNYASDSDLHLLRADFSENPETLQADSTAKEIQYSPSTSTSEIDNIKSSDIFYIAGATLNAIKNKKSICEACINTLKDAEDIAQPNVPAQHTLLTKFVNMGGLQMPKSGLYRLCQEAEKAFQAHKRELLSSELSITEKFVHEIANMCKTVKLPSCCNVAEAAILHYLMVRCKGLKTHLQNKTKYNVSFASASTNKKQKKM